MSTSSSGSGSNPTVKTRRELRDEKEERGSHIQVFVRCRPLNSQEKSKKAYSIVEIPSHREVLLKTAATNKSFQAGQF